MTTIIKSDRLTLATLTGDPASVVDGDFWYRSDLDKLKISISEVVGDAKSIPTIPVQAADLADLPTSKITSGTFTIERIPDLPASKIVGGTFSSSLVGTLSAEKITYGTMGAAKIAGERITYGSIDVARIPDLPTTKITSGTFAVERIPDLDTTKITTGTFNVDRIPDLDASKITTGTLAVDRHQLLPNLVGSLGYTKTTFADQNLRTTDSVHFAQVSVGDLRFKNEWRITEDEKYGLILIDEKGKRYALQLREI